MSSLISSTWQLIKRHKGKFVLLGGAVGGLYLLNRHLASWERSWEHSSSRDFVSQVKRKEIHFENTLETCNSTCLSLAPKILDILDELLDPQVLIDQLKSSPKNKIELWAELKVRIFTRMVSEIYCLVLFVAYLRVQLAVIGGYIYVESQGQTGSSNNNVQQKYLGLLQTFYQDGINEIIQPVQEAVRDAFASLGVKDKIVLQDLKVIFDKVKSSMTFTLSSSNSNAARYLLNPDRLSTTEASNGLGPLNVGETELLQRMFNETQDILESDDFRRVLESGIDIGFSIAVDFLLGCFVRLDDESANKENGFTNPHSIHVPLAKLLPVVRNSLAERKKPDEQLVLVRHLICLDVLNCFAANIYEAFCQKEGDGDSKSSKFLSKKD